MESLIKFSKLRLKQIQKSMLKTQRLVLIPKGNKPVEEPSLYRPLYMLDTVVKILDRIIHSRFEDALAETSGLSEKQYGFRLRGRRSLSLGCQTHFGCRKNLQ